MGSTRRSATRREDSPEIHAFDTVKGSDYLGDQDAIEVFTREAVDDLYQLENWGCVFSRDEEGRIAQRPFGAAGAPRTAYAADITGHVLIQVLYEQMMRRDVPVYEEYFAWKLVVEDGRCQGVICWDLVNGGLKTIGAKTVILCTGGAGRLFRATTNAHACTGDGMAMALRAGVPLKDMEMMQFHPTTLYPSGILITEGCRGEGGYLINKDGERFMERYAPNAMELASRDVVSRSEQTEIDEGRGVNGSIFLDLRHLGAEKILDAPARLTRAGDDLRRRRPDLRADPGPAGGPLPHGRRRHRRVGQDRARGAVRRRRGACVSVHGANRLGGNSLMETITFGRRSGRAAAEWALSHTTVTVRESVAADAERELKTLLDRTEGERPWRIRDELGASMLENFGVFRQEEKMHEQLEVLEGLRERYRARRRRGQGQRLQQRPDPGDRARVHARPRGVHDHGGDRPQGEPWRARPAARLSDARRRELHAALDHALDRRPPRARLEARDDDQVAARGTEVLGFAGESIDEEAMDVALKIWRFDPESGERELRRTRSRRPSGRTCSTCSTSSRTSTTARSRSARAAG